MALVPVGVLVGALVAPGAEWQPIPSDRIQPGLGRGPGGESRFCVALRFQDREGVVEKEKKYWFRRLSYNSWLPISWEGWITIVIFVGVLWLILRLTGARGREAFVFARHWPLLAATGITILAFFRVTRGRVRK